MSAKPLFTFAIIADTHINPVDGHSGSPWPSNAFANDRARWAVAALSADAPEFVIHLGDMVHPIPEQPDYADAVDRFHAITADLPMPLHLIPGNHDLGDKPANGTPAHPVSTASIAAYRRYFGPLWSAFDFQDCRFVMHANPLLGSDLPEDDEQWEWLENELRGRAGKRIFFFTHYPLYLTYPDEDEHYDNLAPGPRARLCKMLRAYEVEAVFAAHVHTIFHTRLGEYADGPLQHVVPTLAALRPDYSHLFKAPPPINEENGRNDSAKLGYYLVDVFEAGYRLRLRRSHGATLTDDEARPDIPAIPRHDLALRNLGVDLRQGWAEPRTIPYSGVVDEFGRKPARNDYLIAALQEAGIRDLRVPVQDFQDENTRRRMHDLTVLGHQFHIFTLTPPDPKTIALLSEEPRLVSRIELIARREELGELIRLWRHSCPDLPLVASPLWTSADAGNYGSTFSHTIGHGFPCDKAGRADAEIFATAADGAMFRIRAGENVEAAFESLRSYGHMAVIYLDLGMPSPADYANDEAATAERVRAAVAGLEALGVGAVTFFDTLEDLDRGYYPRFGLYDIRLNPRLAARVLMGAA